MRDPNGQIPSFVHPQRIPAEHPCSRHRALPGCSSEKSFGRLQRNYTLLRILFRSFAQVNAPLHRGIGQFPIAQLIRSFPGVFDPILERQ